MCRGHLRRERGRHPLHPRHSRVRPARDHGRQLDRQRHEHPGPAGALPGFDREPLPRRRGRGHRHGTARRSRAQDGSGRGHLAGRRLRDALQHRRAQRQDRPDGPRGLPVRRQDRQGPGRGSDRRHHGQQPGRAADPDGRQSRRPDHHPRRDDLEGRWSLAARPSDRRRHGHAFQRRRDRPSGAGRPDRREQFPWTYLSGQPVEARPRRARFVDPFGASGRRFIRRGLQRHVDVGTARLRGRGPAEAGASDLAGRRHQGRVDGHDGHPP